MLAGGIIGLAVEAWRRSRLGAAAWLCVLAGGALRIAPTSIPISVSDRIGIALAILFGVLTIARFALRSKAPGQ